MISKEVIFRELDGGEEDLVKGVLFISMVSLTSVLSFLHNGNNVGRKKEKKYHKNMGWDNNRIGCFAGVVRWYKSCGSWLWGLIKKKR